MNTRNSLLFLLLGTCFGADKPRAFVTGQNSFQIVGSGGEQSVSGVGDSTVAEGTKLFQKNCAVVSVKLMTARVRGEKAGEQWCSLHLAT